MRLRVDEAALAREASRLSSEISRLVPRQYARGGPVMPGAVVLVSSGPGQLRRSASFDPPSVSDTPPPPRSRFYAGNRDLDRMIADPTIDIRDVVREVERLCNREAHAAVYYREHPELLGRSHPWLKFVATGEAAYLGWARPAVASGTSGRV